MNRWVGKLSKLFARQSRAESADEQALRAYLSETRAGLRDDRSTASYALEFMKTERSNLLMSQRDCARHITHIGQLLEELGKRPRVIEILPARRAEKSKELQA